MRVALWLSVLVALFVAASLIQERFTDAAREERAIARGERAGFGRARIGAPSGAPVVEGFVPTAPRPPTLEPAAPPTRGPSTGGGLDRASEERVHVVLRGESLSAICERHYETSRADLVSAVARFNGIERVDAIREGQRIRLPPPSALRDPRRSD